MFTKRLVVDVLRGCGNCLLRKKFEMDDLCVDCCWREICEQLSFFIAEFKSLE